MKENLIELARIGSGRSPIRELIALEKSMMGRSLELLDLVQKVLSSSALRHGTIVSGNESFRSGDSMKAIGLLHLIFSPWLSPPIGLNGG